MGKLRTGETDEFPVESRGGGINYILVYPEQREESRLTRVNGDIQRRERTIGFQHFKSTKGQKEKLLSALEDIDDPSEWDLLGVWKGRHRSDTFELDIEGYRERMESADL